MIKRLLPAIFVSAMLLSVLGTSTARATVEVIEDDLQEVTITMTSVSTLHVTGAYGMTLDIYNVAGMKVMSVKIDSTDKRYELNLPKGCYIVKVGKTVRKISIR